MAGDPGIGVVYATHRSEPRLDWFADSLAAQLQERDELEVVVVDGLHSGERTDALERAVGGRFPIHHVVPKPSAYNGPHRRTRRDLFAVANARNTGAVHTTKPYLVFLDDCSVLGPGWLGAVRESAAEDRVVCGAYEKRRQMVVEGGELVRSEAFEGGVDTRQRHVVPGDLVQIAGGQLYGSSFGLPRDLLLAVNGLDELCDPIGGEDYQFGIRLEWTGEPIHYDRRMFTVEAAGPEYGESPPRVGRALSPETYLARLGEFGVDARSTDGACDNSHMVLDLLYGTRETTALGNDFELARLEPADLAGLAERLPGSYWFDGTPLEEL